MAKKRACLVLKEGCLLGGTRYFPVWQAAKIIGVCTRCVRYRIARKQFNGVVRVPNHPDRWLYLIPAKEVFRHRDRERVLKAASQ